MAGMGFLRREVGKGAGLDRRTVLVARTKKKRVEFW